MFLRDLLRTMLHLHLFDLNHHRIKDANFTSTFSVLGLSYNSRLIGRLMKSSEK